MRIHTRVDYCDIDGKVILSDPITCAEDEEKLHEISKDPAVWDIVYYGLEDEDSTEVVELGRISRVTEVDGEEP